MKKGEKLFRFLASLILCEFYGTVTIKFENGKVTHVETETRRKWQYDELPSHRPDEETTMMPSYLGKVEGP